MNSEYGVECSSIINEGQAFIKRKWSDEDLKYLNDNYPTVDTKELSKIMNRSVDSIVIMAGKIGIKKVVSVLKKNRLEVLLDDSILSMYWLGFIFADGSVDDRRLSVTLAQKDRGHLVMLSEHIGGIVHDYAYRTSFGSSGTCRLSVMDTKVVRELLNRFELRSNKTYNPPSTDALKSIPIEKRIAMWVGFIDGDGSINVLNRHTSPYNINIKIHSSWKHVLELLISDMKEFFDINSATSVITDKKGYIRTSLSHLDIILSIKQYIINNDIPVLERKWSCIDINIPRKIKKLKTSQIQEALRLYSEGVAIYPISKQFGVSHSVIKKIVFP